MGGVYLYINILGVFRVWWMNCTQCQLTPAKTNLSIKCKVSSYKRWEYGRGKLIWFQLQLGQKEKTDECMVKKKLELLGKVKMTKNVQIVYFMGHKSGFKRLLLRIPMQRREKCTTLIYSTKMTKEINGSVLNFASENFKTSKFSSRFEV